MLDSICSNSGRKTLEDNSDEPPKLSQERGFRINDISQQKIPVQSTSFSITQKTKLKIDEIIQRYEEVIQDLNTKLRNKEKESISMKGTMQFYEKTIYSSKSLIDELVSKNKLLKEKLLKYKAQC